MFVLGLPIVRVLVVMVGVGFSRIEYFEWIEDYWVRHAESTAGGHQEVAMEVQFLIDGEAVSPLAVFMVEHTHLYIWFFIFNLHSCEPLS